LHAAAPKKLQDEPSATKIISFISFHVYALIQTLFYLTLTRCKERGRLYPTDNLLR